MSLEEVARAEAQAAALETEVAELRARLAHFAPEPPSEG
jgi:hypothetical protein